MSAAPRCVHGPPPSHEQGRALSCVGAPVCLWLWPAADWCAALSAWARMLQRLQQPDILALAWPQHPTWHAPWPDSPRLAVGAGGRTSVGLGAAALLMRKAGVHSGLFALCMCAQPQELFLFLFGRSPTLCMLCALCAVRSWPGREPSRSLLLSACQYLRLAAGRGPLQCTQASGSCFSISPKSIRHS